eukprot:SAG31_NODE_9393_length_1285_cov_0.985666_2_plen_39_part_01
MMLASDPPRAPAAARDPRRILKHVLNLDYLKYVLNFSTM